MAALGLPFVYSEFNLSCVAHFNPFFDQMLLLAIKRITFQRYLTLTVDHPIPRQFATFWVNYLMLYLHVVHTPENLKNVLCLHKLLLFHMEFGESLQRFGAKIGPY